MDEKLGAPEASHWFRNQPARRLASFVRPMQEAMRASVIEAEKALWLPLMSEGYESLLVLHPVRPVEPIADYVFKGDRINKDTGILRPRDAEAVQFRHADAPLLIPEKRAPVYWAADDLTHFWQHRNAGDAAFDTPPGFPPGAVLGVLEADAARLWPALSGGAAQSVRQLHAVPTAENRAEQWKAACEGCKPPDGFGVPLPGRKRFLWLPSHRAELLRQFEALEAACGKQAPALVELHQRWGYAVPKSDKGGSLTKVLTKAREERDARQPRRSVKARR